MTSYHPKQILRYARVPGNQGWPRRVIWATISSLAIAQGGSHGHETARRPAARGILAAAARNVPHPVGARGRGAARLRDHEECDSALRGQRAVGAGDALWIAEAAAGGAPSGRRWRAGRPGAGRRATPLLPTDTARPIRGACGGATAGRDGACGAA